MIGSAIFELLDMPFSPGKAAGQTMGRAWGWILLCVVLLLPSMSWGSGFFTPEVGAKAIARGGAFIASVDDLTAMYLNPGGLSRVKGTNLYMNSNFDVMYTYYRREDYLPAVRNRNPLDVIPFFGVSTDFHLDDWTFAFGLFGPNGVTQRYPYSGPQRYVVLESNSVQIYYTLGVGWHPIRWARLGFDIMMTQFAKEDYYAFSVLRDRNSKYDVNACFMAKSEFLPTWAAGIILEPVPWFHLGFSYIAASNPDLTGSLSADMPEFYASLLGFDRYEDKIEVGITYPEQYRGGVRWLFRDIFDIELAFSYIPWSKLVSFPVDLEKEILIEDFDLWLLWEDSWSYRIGGTYRLGDHWEFHGGYYWEGPAAPDATMGPGGVEGDRNALGTGLTLKYFGFDLTLAYSHVFMSDRIIPSAAPGTLDDGRGKYKGSFDMLDMSINMNFEKLYYSFKGYRPQKGKEAGSE
jgi:long-subunit fatty acid transport protein